MSRDDDSVTDELSSRDLEEIPEELLAGDLPAPLGMYLLLHLLAESPTCQVFLASAVELEAAGRLCVVKRIRRSVSGEPGFEARFTEAMRRLVHLDHRNVAQVFDTSQVDRDFFIAREFVLGCTLDELLRVAAEGGRPMPLDVALLLAVDVLRALYHALRQPGPGGEPLRLWHGRLRPRSVLLTSKGEVKLIGFDREWEPATLDTAEEGPGFVAPELAADGVGGARSDVYSGGRLLERLLRATGTEGDRRVHPGLAPLIERALAPDREQRPRDVGALLRPLRAALHRVNPRCGPPDLEAYLRDAAGDLLRGRESLARFLVESHAQTARDGSQKGRAKTRTLLLESDEKARVRAIGRAVEKADPLLGLLPGTKYRILRPIGEGGMGTVYAAEHVDLEKVFALKILHKEKRSKADLDTLRKEARAASKLGHPNIVSVTDFGETPDGRVFFVMEYLEGESLGEVIEGGPVDQERAVGILIQVCDALAAAHDKGVVHRDIKPDNIFLVRRTQGEETVKLLDFGVAVVEEAAEQKPESIAGTPHYMSPELINFQPIDGRSDLYSLGVVAYEALVGFRPFGQGPLIELLRRQIREPPKPIRSIPEGRNVHPALEAVVLRALAKKPRDRFQTARDMAAELRAVRAFLRGEAAAAEAAADLIAGSQTLQQEIESTWTAALERAGVERRPRRRRVALGWLVAIGAVVAAGTALVILSPPWRYEGPRADDPVAVAAGPEPPAPASPLVEAGPSSLDASADAPAEREGDAAGDGEPAVDADSTADAGSADAASSPAGGAGREPESRAGRARRHARAGTRAFGRGQYAEAQADFERALQLDSRNLEALSGLGRIAFQRGNYAEAERHARRALERYPESARFRLDLGAALFRQGRRDQAAVLFRQVLADDPGNQAARRYLEAATRPR